MIATIVGCVWILGGVFFLLKPDWMKSHIQKKGVKGVRRLLFGLALAIGVLMLGAAYDIGGGVIGTVLVILGVLAILKAFFFLRSAFTEKVIAWIEPQPLVVFRALAGVYILVGLALIFGIRMSNEDEKGALNESESPRFSCLARR